MRVEAKESPDVEIRDRQLVRQEAGESGGLVEPRSRNHFYEERAMSTLQIDALDW